MKELSLLRIAEWTDGALLQGRPADTVSAISTDSRKVAPGDLFVAIRGERIDAHKFLGDVAGAGAAAMLVSALPLETESYRGGIIRVKDTLTAIQRLAWHHRKASEGLFVVGLTGSNGKTSTKDFLASVLSRGGRVNATEGNFNNHIGLPLTILAGDGTERFGVWEMGMNHPGEIGLLADIATPDAAVVTTIGTAHIEFMGSREAIAAEKASLPASVPAGGFCAMPAKDEFFGFVRDRVRCEVVPVGIGEGAVRAERLVCDKEGKMRFDLASDTGRTVSVALPVRGEHMVMNALLAAATGLRCGISPEDVSDALASVTLTKGRLEEKKVRGISFLDDSYNANPDSMLAGLRALKASSVEGRRIAVFGFMGELGDHEETEHRKLGERVVEQGIDLLVTVGERAARINEGAEALSINRNFPTHEEAAAFLREALQPGDLVLVKGSRSAGMERVIAAFA